MIINKNINIGPSQALSFIFNLKNSTKINFIPDCPQVLLFRYQYQ